MILYHFSSLQCLFGFVFNLATSVFISTRETFLHYFLQLFFFVGEGHLRLTRADSVKFLVASLLARVFLTVQILSTFLFILYTATAGFCYYLNSSLLPTKSCPCKIIGESNKLASQHQHYKGLSIICLSVHSGTGEPFYLAMVLPGSLEQDILLSF